MSAIAWVGMLVEHGRTSVTLYAYAAVVAGECSSWVAPQLPVWPVLCARGAVVRRTVTAVYCGRVYVCRSSVIHCRIVYSHVIRSTHAIHVLPVNLSMRICPNHIPIHIPSVIAVYSKTAFPGTVSGRVASSPRDTTSDNTAHLTSL